MSKKIILTIVILVGLASLIANGYFFFTKVEKDSYNQGLKDGQKQFLKEAIYIQGVKNGQNQIMGSIVQQIQNSGELKIQLGDEALIFVRKGF